MRATTLIGVALVALSTAAIAQVATVPAKNKTTPSVANQAAVANDAAPSAQPANAADDAPPATAETPAPDARPPK